jgi:hypothetical protein
VPAKPAVAPPVVGADVPPISDAAKHVAQSQNTIPLSGDASGSGHPATQIVTAEASGSGLTKQKEIIECRKRTPSHKCVLLSSTCVQNVSDILATISDVTQVSEVNTRMAFHQTKIVQLKDMIDTVHANWSSEVRVNPANC